MNRIVVLALGLVISARAGFAQGVSHAAANAPDAGTVVVRAEWLIDGAADTVGRQQ